jgi:FkbM family methyltransferase
MPDYERLLELFYCSFLRPGNLAVDVGAHTGRHAIPIARAVAPGGRVIAYEPLPLASQLLQQTVDTEGVDVTVRPFALGDRDGRHEFVFAVDLPAYSGLRTRVYDGPTRIEKLTVDVRTLDGELLPSETVDYIKIDAEGGELGILRGAKSLLSRCAPVVTFEFGANSIGSYDISVADMADFWRDKPYVIHDILGQPLTRDGFVSSALKQDLWDYVALPTSRVSQILKIWRRD